MDAKAHQVLSGSEEEISKDSGKGKRRHTVRGKMGQGVSLSERPKESPRHREMYGNQKEENVLRKKIREDCFVPLV